MKALLALPILGLLCLYPGQARSAESYDNCVGFVDSLPAVITTQGTWCLRKDLSTGMATGTAINIAKNNVTIDCNDFKIGGLSAGIGTQAIGINATDRSNLTIRNCGLRGFFYGINLDGEGAGHLVENNRIDGSTWVGIGVEGDGSVVRGNRVMDTGGTTLVANPAKAIAIYTQWDVEILGNLVSGVYAPAGSNGHAIAINPGNNLSGSVIDNNVKNVIGDGTGFAYGISFWGDAGQVSVDSNNLIGPGLGNSVGVWCQATKWVGLSDNIAAGFTSAMFDCSYDHGNIVR